MANSLDVLARTVARGLLPLGEIAGEADVIAQALSSLGFAAPPGIDLASVLSLDVSDLSSKLETVLDSTLEEQQDQSLMAGRYTALAVSVGQLIDAVVRFATDLPAKLAGAGDYVAKSGIVAALPRRLLDRLIVDAVGQASAPTAFCLRMLGIFGVDVFAADASIYQTEHRRIVVRYERLGLLLSDPRQLFIKEYGWGTASFDAHAFLSNAGALLQSLGLRPLVRDMPRAAEEAL